VSEERNLSDGDVKAIVDALETRMATSFKQKVGEGFLGMVWKGLFTAMMFLAAFGAMKYGIGGQQ
jgi:hypothetical protein